MLLAILGVKPAKVAAADAIFYVSPSGGSYKAGDKITASILVNTGGQAINAGEATVTFSTDTLEYQSVSSSGSIFTFWTSGPTGGATSVSFSGGLSNPGYTGSAGKVITITFKAKTTGTGHIWIYNGKILANDGQGTNVMGTNSGATYTIGTTPTPGVGAPIVRSSTHPDQARWYNSTNVSLNWSASSATSYVYAFDQSASTDPPGNLSSDTSKTYNNVADGVWYFHIKAKSGTSAFTSVTHFRVNIDTGAPDEFKVTVNQEEKSTNPSPTVTFAGQDKTSGIAKYEARIDGGDAFAIATGDKLPKRSPGDHILVIKAFDAAGNTREASATYHIEGIAALKIIDWSPKVALLKPVAFTGVTPGTDTVIVFRDGKEIARFIAKDKLATTSKNGTVAQAQTEGDVTFLFEDKDRLFPGTYNYTFQRVDTNGAESELTKPYQVQILAAVVNVWGYTVPVTYVVFAMIGVIILLVFILLILLVRVRRKVQGSKSVAGVKALMHRVLSRTEHAIDHEIESTVPTSESSGGVLREVKKDLKQKVRTTIDEQENSIK
jgi:hypothetical protein